MNQEIVKADPHAGQKRSKGNIWLLLAILALIYVISPVDLLPLDPIDDIPVGGFGLTSLVIYFLKRAAWRHAQEVMGKNK